MSSQELTLPQSQKLKELSKRFAYELAVEKKVFDQFELSDYEKLEALVLLEMSQVLSGPLNDYMTESCSKGILTSERLMVLMFDLHIAFLQQSFEIVKEKTPEEKDGMILVASAVLTQFLREQS